MPSLSETRLRWSWEGSIHWFWLFLFIIIVFGPLVALTAEAAQYVRTDGYDWFALVVPAGRRLGLLVHSLALAVGVAVSGIVIGMLVGSALWRWRTGTRAYFRWVPLVLIALPAYVYALAWSSTVSTLGLVLQSFGLPGIQLTGWVGSWWVEVMALMPIGVGLSMLGLESVEIPLIEAARLLDSDFRVFARVILPLAAPIIAAGVSFLFLLSFADYSVPSLFAVSVYPLEIFAEYSASNQPARAFLLALSALFLMVVVVAVSQSGLRNAAQAPIWQGRTSLLAMRWPAWFVWLQRGAVAVYMLQIGVISISLIFTVGAGANLTSAIVSAASEIGFTFWVGLTTGLMCLPVAFAAAKELLRSGARGRTWWFLVTVPLAVPAPLIGIGLISIWNQSFWIGLYGTAMMPVLATLARFTPMAALVLLAQLRQIDPLLVDAARVFQTSSLHAWLRVRLPLLAPGVLAAAAIVFALSIGELGATLIVAPPGQATLTMRIYNYLHYGSSSVVAGLCLMMVALTLAVGILAILALASWSRISEEQT